MTMFAQVAIAETADFDNAVTRVLGNTGGLWSTHDIDLALVFASHHFAPQFEELVQQVRDMTGARVILGCSGAGIIGRDREIEDAPAVTLLVASLPGAVLRTFRLTGEVMQHLSGPEEWQAAVGVRPEDVNAFVLFADPFRLDCEAMVEGLTKAYPGTPLVGGLASADLNAQRTHVFLNTKVYAEGAVGIAIGGALTVRTVVAQGAMPIGQPWTITETDGNVIRSIGQRPAYELLMETLRALPERERRRAQRNLLVGLAMNEYRDSFGRGDFLVRNVVGADPRSGTLLVGAAPRVGQTLQFQIRDSRAADDDLRELLTAAHRELGEQRPVAALLCACNGRGSGLFGTENHDVQAVLGQLGMLPLAGFFCNGEIGPVGERSFLHGYTASIALLVPAPERT